MAGAPPSGVVLGGAAAFGLTGGRALDAARPDLSSFEPPELDPRDMARLDAADAAAEPAGELVQ